MAVLLPPRCALGLTPLLGRVRISSRFAARCSGNGSLRSSLKLDAAGYQNFPSQIYRSVRIFVKEQFSEFQKIEWPSLENTVRTSLFVIALSFLLVVALTAIDSGYSFLLSKMIK